MASIKGYEVKISQWIEHFIVSFNRPAPQVETLFSVMSAEVTDRETKNVHHLLWNTAPVRELSGEFCLTLLLTVLSESIESMRPSDIGELIGWTHIMRVNWLKICG